jgi:hypothetical protein
VEIAAWAEQGVSESWNIPGGLVQYKPASDLPEWRRRDERWRRWLEKLWINWL